MKKSLPSLSEFMGKGRKEAMVIYALNIEQLGQEKWFQRAYDTVEESRKKKVAACKVEADKLRSLGAGLLLAYGVSKALKEPWRKLKEHAVIEYGEHGKPYFKSWEGIEFNLSHSGSYAACAVSTGENPYVKKEQNRVGIDIQKVLPCHLKTAKRAFLKEEYERLEELFEKDEDKAALLFTKLWTKKESIGKLLGTGVFLSEKEEEKIMLKDYIIDGEYLISAASQQQEFPEQICQVTVEEVLAYDKISNVF